MSADIVITGARVRTGASEAPLATGLAVRGGVIEAVGSDAAVLAHAGARTRLRDLRGAIVMPGFADVHNHHALAGRTALFELTLGTELGLDGILARVAAHATGLAPDAWIIGAPWASTLLPELDTPEARRRLDAAAGGRAVLLTEDSRHNRWASTRARELAGIGADAPEVLREASGLPLAEAAAREGALTAEQHRAASRRGVSLLNAYGITSFQDAATSLEILAALAGLDSDGELDAWAVSSMSANDPLFGHDPIGIALLDLAEQHRTRHHRPDFIKVFLDGVPTARTAAFLEPYPCAEGGTSDHGTPTMSRDELAEWLVEAAQRGLGAKVHCTGDASARLLLDAVEVARATGAPPARVQLAHGPYIDDADVERLARLGVAVDTSPFLWFPGVIPEALTEVLGDGRAQRAHPHRRLLDAGVLLAGGSDWPVCESPNPLEGIQGLVTRADPLGRASGTFGADQAVTVDEAFGVFSRGAAAAMGLGGITGSLRAGMSADFVILDRDPVAGLAEEIVEAVVRETWFAGRTVYMS